jgi:site-specific DNA-methyltransferase (adenine-specific)
MILFGDCKEKLKELDDDSIDAAVTDPPYELGFMGKKWDASGIAYNVELWKECLRVLKPGGHLLSFGGTRTYHRMAVAIEDAGFEIRDMLEWIYASGFPKSQNVGKAFDKKMGNERDKVGEDNNFGVSKAEQGKNAFGDYEGKWHITKGNSQWEGFGTALKPAHEPIVLARKPLSEKTIVENCIKHGAGALDIDGCRIPTSKKDQNYISERIGGFNNTQSIGGIYGDGKVVDRKKIYDGSQDRFPANLLVTDDALNDGVMTKSGKVGMTQHGSGSNKVYGKYKNSKQSYTVDGVSDSGSKSRYFDIDVWGENHGLIQCPKASKSERNAGCEGLEKKLPVGGADKWTEQDRRKGDGITAQPRSNHHPTVKPIHLISWLIRLVSKDGDTVLDPFMGSGTTGVACKQLNRNFIGIESNEEYIKIAEKRIAHRNFLWRWYR